MMLWVVIAAYVVYILPSAMQIVEGSNCLLEM